MIAGRPPFRGATEYLTFQKVLACEYEFPDKFDPLAKALIERILVSIPWLNLLQLQKTYHAACTRQKLDPADRPTVDSIRDDPFFSSINFSNIWTDHIPDIKTGIAPPVKMVQQTLDFTDAFDTTESDEERNEIDLADEADQGLTTSSRPGFERAASRLSPTAELKLPFPDHLVSGPEHLREPQRKWIEAGGNTFSSTETFEEAAWAKSRSTVSGPTEKEGGLTRKLTHQWEQEERRKLW